jgi:hypothetical protein
MIEQIDCGTVSDGGKLFVNGNQVGRYTVKRGGPTMRRLPCDCIEQIADGYISPCAEHYVPGGGLADRRRCKERLRRHPCHHAMRQTSRPFIHRYRWTTLSVYVPRF